MRALMSTLKARSRIWRVALLALLSLLLGMTSFFLIGGAAIRSSARGVQARARPCAARWRSAAPPVRWPLSHAGRPHRVAMRPDRAQAAQLVREHPWAAVTTR